MSQTSQTKQATAGRDICLQGLKTDILSYFLAWITLDFLNEYVFM